MLKYSGACNFYYRGKRCVPLQGLTWSSIARFGSRRCFCTLELATSTIEAEGVFLCGSVTRARSHLQFQDLVVKGVFVLWSLQLLFQGCKVFSLVGALPLSLLVQIYTCFIELGIKGCFSHLSILISCTTVSFQRYFTLILQ